jgi:hypothetical protein
LFRVPNPAGAVQPAGEQSVPAKVPVATEKPAPPPASSSTRRRAAQPPKPASSQEVGLTRDPEDESPAPPVTHYRGEDPPMPNLELGDSQHGKRDREVEPPPEFDVSALAEGEESAVEVAPLESEEAIELEPVDPQASTHLRPARRRRRQGLDHEALSQWLTPYALTLYCIGALAALLLGIGFFFPPLLLALLALGVVVNLAGSLWFLYLSFEDAEGCFCLVIPFYAFYYAYMNFEHVWRSVLLSWLGGFLAGLAGGLFLLLGHR